MRLPIEPSGGSAGFPFVCYGTSASVNSPSTGTPDAYDAEQQLTKALPKMASAHLS
jgi:hypothetical protein